MSSELIDYMELTQAIEHDTGFACYEGQPGNQTVFYGTSDMFNDFKQMAGDHFDTGTVVFTMDDSAKYMYSSFKKQWYAIG